MQSVAERCDAAPGWPGIRPGTSQIGANTIVAALVIGAYPPYLGGQSLTIDHSPGSAVPADISPSTFHSVT